MADLTDAEAKLLIELEKIATDKRVDIPSNSQKVHLNLSSAKEKDDNIMRIYIKRGKRNINKCSFNVVYNKSITLLRLDIEPGRIHQNPDGKDVPNPHLHIYREGYDDRYAEPLPECFADTANLAKTLYDLLGYSNVINRDKVEIFDQGVLFNGLNQ